MIAAALVAGLALASEQRVTVDEGVQLEVIDWGGSGQPIVLLAGYLTAHAFDEFAPKLTPLGHVYGITRRGFGASSRPAASGYTSQRHALDILQVLDALHIGKAVLAGHSFGGQDQTIFAQMYPDRVAGLVYLNSAEDPTVTDYGVKPSDPAKLPAAVRARPPKEDMSSIQAYRESQKRIHGVSFPESELRQSFAVNTDGSLGKYLVPKEVQDAIFKGIEKPDFARIKSPVLAFFADLEPFERIVNKFAARTTEEREALEQDYRFRVAIHDRHVSDLLKGVPSATIVNVPDANFYIFLSSEPQIIDGMTGFFKRLR